MGTESWAQARPHLFNIWRIGTHGRTSAQPHVRKYTIKLFPQILELSAVTHLLWCITVHKTTSAGKSSIESLEKILKKSQLIVVIRTVPFTILRLTQLQRLPSLPFFLGLFSPSVAGKVFVYISCGGGGLKDRLLNLFFSHDIDVTYHRLSAMRWRYLHTI